MAIKNIISLTETPTISTGAYASGDLLGTLMKFKSSELSQNQRCVIQSLIVFDKDKENIDVDVVIFESNPSSTTFTDNAALAIADADLDKIAHVESLTSYVDFSDNSVAESQSMTIPVTFTDSIYVCLVTRGAPTYTATTDISLKLSIIQD
jgi:hypothetical protein